MATFTGMGTGMHEATVNARTLRDATRLSGASGGDPVHTASGRRRRVQTQLQAGPGAKDAGWDSHWGKQPRLAPAAGILGGSMAGSMGAAFSASGGRRKKRR